MSNPVIPKCRLCQNKEADQTGSHIFSWFLIKDAINKAGFKERDNEVMFTISENEFIDAYFGSGQSNEDAVIAVRGKPLTEGEIEKTKSNNPFKRDNILCRDCEKRLQVIESLVSKNIIQPLRKKLSVKEIGFEVWDVEECELIRIFVYSQVWRAAITAIDGFRMEEAHMNQLREILDTNLEQDAQKLRASLTINSKTIKEIGVIATFLEVSGTNNNSIFCSHNYKPYALLLNDLAIQLYFKDAKNNGFDISFCGINDFISKRALTNSNEEKFKIGIICNSKREKVQRKLLQLVAAKMMKYARENFIAGFKKLYGEAPHNQLVRYFEQEAWAEKDKFLLANFDTAHFVEIAANVMLDYANANSEYLSKT